MRSLSSLLNDLKHAVQGDHVSVRFILEEFHERGFGFFLFLMALPMALPLPVPPGVNVLLASPLLLLTGQQALGRHTIWLPERLRQKKFQSGKVVKLIDKALPFVQKLELLCRPRLGFITQGIFLNLIGVFGFIMALSICVPIPLTNTVPSFGIALMAVGVLMRDGLAVLAGAVIGLAWVFLLVFAFLFFGAEAIDLIKDFIKGMIAG